MSPAMRPGLLAATAVLLAGCASVKPLARDERLLAAVMPFAYSAPVKDFSDSAEGLADAVAGALVRTGRLRLVERHRVDAVLQEVRHGMTGAVDSATAAQVGRQLGAEAVVIGAITSASVMEESRSMKIAEKADRRAEVVVEARLVAVETGELLASARAVGKAVSRQRQAFGGKLGELAPPEILVQRALQDIGEDLARNLARGAPSRSAVKR